MKIRIIGTMEECAAAREYYSELEKQENVRSVTTSREYPCRDGRTQYRLYVEVWYDDISLSGYKGKGAKSNSQNPQISGIKSLRGIS